MNRLLKKFILSRKVGSVLTLLTFVLGQIVLPSMARAEIGMLGTVPNTAFAPPVLLGLKIHPENPLLFDFIVDRGQVKLSDEQFKAETIKLVKYFLAALTIPDKESWVNLSPTEKDRIIPDALGRTEMGKTMLEQDYVLKQLAATLTNPQTELGKRYWAEVGSREASPVKREAKEQESRFTNDASRATLSKVWIVPEKAKVIESNGIVLVDEKKLKVLMAEEYENSMSSPRKVLLPDTRSSSRGSILNDQEKMDSRFRGNDMSGGNANFPNQAPGPNHQEPSFEVFHNLILPRINQEINESQSFAPVRQIYNSVILAAWYKQALKESLLGKVYTDKAKTAGVETDDKQMKERVYQQYLEAFKKGAYNFIKEQEDPATGEMIPRKYFSGGLTIAASAVLDRKVSSREVEAKLEASSPNTEIVTVLNDEEKVATSSPGILRDIDKERVLKEIGLNLKYVTGDISQYDSLIRLYLDLPTGVTPEGLTDDDIRFLTYYGEIFGEEYYTGGNISGYKSKSMRKRRVEQINLDWDQLSTYLVGKSWARKSGDDEIVLLADPQEMDLSVFGEDEQRILKFLIEVYHYPFIFTEIGRKRARSLADNFRFTKSMKILDYGCGMGLIVGALREIGYQVWGAEISSFVQQYAWSGVRDFITILRNRSDLEYLQDQKYDFVMAKDIIEHVPMKILPRFLISLSKLTPKGFIMLPFTDSSGKFINKDDEKDLTHVVRREKKWWMDLIGDNSVEMEKVNEDLKGENSKGTLSLAVDFGESFRKAILDHDWLKEMSASSIVTTGENIIAGSPYVIIPPSAASGVKNPQKKFMPIKNISDNPESRDTFGGIDFDASKLNLQIKRDGHGVPLPLPRQNVENIHIDGLFPVIINIQPVNAQTLPLLMGQNTPPESSRQPAGV